MTTSPSDRRRRDEEPAEPVMTIGHNKGVPLTQITTHELERTREWCRKVEEEEHSDRFKTLIEAIDEELEDRRGLPLFPH